MCICKGGLIAFHPHSFAGTARLYGSGRGDCLTCHPSCDHCSVGRTACMLSVWLLSHAYWLWWPGTPHPPPCMFVQGGGCGCMWSCAGALVTSQAWWVGWCPHPPLASIGVCCLPAHLHEVCIWLSLVTWGWCLWVTWPDLSACPGVWCLGSWLRGPMVPGLVMVACPPTILQTSCGSGYACSMVTYMQARVGRCMVDRIGTCSCSCMEFWVLIWWICQVYCP
jgi:hypothetical protein